MTHAAISGLESWLGQQIIGQADLVRKLLIAILADGHLLVEGAPGLAKTRAIKMMAEGVEGDFHRVRVHARSTAGRHHGYRYLPAAIGDLRVPSRPYISQSDSC